jgi:hypothetical protein
VEVPAEGEGIAAFVVLIDAETGSTQLRYASGAPGQQAVRALGADRDENVVIAGDFDQRLDIGPERFFSNGGRDVFIAKLSPSGEILFRGTYGGPGNDTAEGISVSPADDALQLSLLTEGGIDFGSGALTKGSHFVHLSSAPDVRSCATDNPCSVGACDPLKGCLYSDLPDGSACQGAGKPGKCVAGTCSIGN